MRRGHVTRFLDQGSACAVMVPDDLVLPARRVTATHHQHPLPVQLQQPQQHQAVEDVRADALPLVGYDSPKPKFNNDDNNYGIHFGNKFNYDFKHDTAHPSMKLVNNFESVNGNNGEFKAPVVVNGTFSGLTPAVPSKGIISAPAVHPRLCGLMKGSSIKEEVTPLSVLEKIQVQTLMPEYHKGVVPPSKKSAAANPLLPPMKASDLWAEKTTLILVLRRPGCVMCRAEAHQLYTRKPIFDAMGIQLVVCLNEHIESEKR